MSAVEPLPYVTLLRFQGQGFRVRAWIEPLPYVTLSSVERSGFRVQGVGMDGAVAVCYAL
jgi:hypothetical protein